MYVPKCKGTAKLLDSVIEVGEFVKYQNISNMVKNLITKYPVYGGCRLSEIGCCKTEGHAPQPIGNGNLKKRKFALFLQYNRIVLAKKPATILLP